MTLCLSFTRISVSLSSSAEKVSLSFLSPGLWCRGEVPLHRARQRPRLLWGEEVTLRPSAAVAFSSTATLGNWNPKKATRKHEDRSDGGMSYKSCCRNVTGFPRVLSGLWSLGGSTRHINRSGSNECLSLSLSLSCLLACLGLSLALPLGVHIDIFHKDWAGTALQAAPWAIP